MFGWLCSYAVMQVSIDNEARALLFARIGHLSVVFAPIVYLHFSRYLLNMKWLEPFYRGYYVLSIPFAYLMWSGDLLVAGVKRQPWGYYPVGGIAMLVEASLLTVIAVACWVLFVWKCREAHRHATFEEYNRLRYCCIALAVFSLGALEVMS